MTVTADPDPFKPLDRAVWHLREACRWMIVAMPEEGVKEMAERLAEIYKSVRVEKS